MRVMEQVWLLMIVMVGIVGVGVHACSGMVFHSEGGNIMDGRRVRAAFPHRA